MGKIAFPRTMRNLDPGKLSSAIAENMRYLENILNQTFNFDHDILSNIGTDDHHAKYLDSEVDSIVAVHAAIAGVHHAKYTDAEVDTIVATHTADVDAHHAKYTDSEVDARIALAGAWTTWSPTYENLTVGNGTVVSRYVEIGDIVIAQYEITFGSTSSITGEPTISTPVTAVAGYTAERLWVGGVVFLDAATNTPHGVVRLKTVDKFQVMALNSAGTYVLDVLLGATVPFTWTTGDMFGFTAIFEKA